MDKDLGVAFFERLFGPGWDRLAQGAVDGTGGGENAASLFFTIFGVINSVAMAATAIVVTYVLAVGLIGTAHEGKPMGQRYSTLWTPVRSSLSFALLAPVPGGGGISMIQAVLLLCLSWSLGWANDAHSKMLDYLKTHGGQVVAEAPPALNDHVTNVALGVMKSLTIQEYYRQRLGGDIPGEWAVWREGGRSDSVENDGGFGRGTMEIQFGAPTSIVHGKKPTATAQDMGAVHIPCATENDSVCQAQTQAVIEMITYLTPHATALVSLGQAGKPEVGAIRGAVELYEARVNPILGQMISQQNPKFQQQLDQSIETMKQVGWIGAGSYYWTIAGFQEATRDALRSFPGYSQPNGDIVSQDAYKDFDAFMEALEQYKKDAVEKVRSAAAGHVRAGEADWQTALREIFSDAFSGWGTEKMIHSISDGDPVLNVSNWGHMLIDATGIAFGSYVVMRAGKEAVEGASKAADDSLIYKGLNFATGGTLGIVKNGLVGLGKGTIEALSPVILLSLTPLFLLGMTLAFYLPAVPFVLWVSGVVGWMIVVVEALVAAPFWAAAHALPEGEGFAGQGGKQGYMLLLNVLARPVLMIAGFAFSIVITLIIGPLLGSAMEIFYWSISAAHYAGPMTMIAMIVIFGSLVLVISHKVFGLVVHVPNRVMAWVGQMERPLGEEGDEQRVRAMFGGAMAAVPSRRPQMPRGGGGAPGGSSAGSLQQAAGGGEGGEGKKGEKRRGRKKDLMPGQS